MTNTAITTGKRINMNLVHNDVKVSLSVEGISEENSQDVVQAVMEMFMRQISENKFKSVLSTEKIVTETTNDVVEPVAETERPFSLGKVKFDDADTSTAEPVACDNSEEKESFATIELDDEEGMRILNIIANDSSFDVRGYKIQFNKLFLQAAYRCSCGYSKRMMVSYPMTKPYVYCTRCNKKHFLSQSAPNFPSVDMYGNYYSNFRVRSAK